MWPPLQNVYFLSLTQFRATHSHIIYDVCAWNFLQWKDLFLSCCEQCYNHNAPLLEVKITTRLVKITYYMPSSNSWKCLIKSIDLTCKVKLRTQILKTHPPYCHWWILSPITKQHSSLFPTQSYTTLYVRGWGKGLHSVMIDYVCNFRIHQ